MINIWPLAIPSTEKWKNIANRFDEFWNLPNCLGKIIGKHVKILKPNNSSSNNKNSKKCSIILLAACGANGLLTIIETAERNNDGLLVSNLSHWLEIEGLNLPPSAYLPHDENRQKILYFFCGDNTFPLKRFLVKPYPVHPLLSGKNILILVILSPFLSYYNLHNTHSLRVLHVSSELFSSGDSSTMFSLL